MNKVTVEFLKSEIVDIEYTRLQGTLTHCAITVKNGFVFTGESACVDAANFDEEIGKKIAYENAFEKMWLPYGFLLKQKTGGDFMFRLTNERAELFERTSKLGTFLQSYTFSQLNEQQRDLLAQQYNHMKQYLGVLDMRISLLDGEI